MSHEPLISVIVPVCNAEEYLGDCLDSILAQTYCNLEILVVDDGSTDGSSDVMTRYSSCDNRVKVFSQSNLGPSAARNRALDAMTGEYVTFVDADDMISHECIEILYMLLTETCADMSVAGLTHDISHLGLNNERFETIDARGYLADVLYQRCSDNSVSAKLYKASLWKNLRFRSMRYEDLEIYPRICLNASVVTVTYAGLYYYRSHIGSFINSFSSDRLDAVRAMQSVRDYLCGTDCGKDVVNAAISRQLSASFNVFLLTCGRPEYDSLNHKTWNDIKQLRLQCLLNRRVIPTIKLGILASMAGPRILRFLNAVFNVSR